MEPCAPRVFAAFAVICSSSLFLAGCKFSHDGANCSLSLGGASCSEVITVNGTYQVIGPPAATFITLFDDGYYALARYGSGSDGCPVAYTEFGAYNASGTDVSSQNGNSSQGATVTATASISSDAADAGQCGFSGTVTVTNNSSNNSSTLTYSTSGGSENFAVNPIDDQGGGSIIGSFQFNDGSGGTGTSIGPGADVSADYANVDILTFLDSTHYFAVNFDSNGPAGGGLEAGCYSASGNQYFLSDDPDSCSVSFADSPLITSPYSNLGSSDTFNGVTITLNGDGSLSYTPSSDVQDSAVPIPNQLND